MESRIRSGESIDADGCGVDRYWADLIRLLQVFAATGDKERIDILKAAMAFKRYGYQTPAAVRAAQLAPLPAAA